MKKVLLSILFILCFTVAGCGGEVENTPDSSDKTTTETIEEPTVESEMLAFVDVFNASSEVTLVFAEDFTPSDKSNSHYRTEFRLSAYSDAIGKSYTFGETVVDIVGRQGWSGGITIRVYMDGATLDQCVEMVKYASPIMDPDIDSNELQKTINYIAENKDANGYYYADLGLVLLGNDTKGYEFMLKMGYD